MRLTASDPLIVCGIPELEALRGRGVTHVLSVLDPAEPEPAAFAAFAGHARVTLRFDDVIGPAPGMIPPTPADVAAILAFGRAMAADDEARLLVHCHYGVSRSTAALSMLLAQAHPEADEDDLFARVHAIRSQAWPNSLMIAYADEALGRGGRLAGALRRLHGRQLAAEPRWADTMKRLNRVRELDEAVAP